MIDRAIGEVLQKRESAILKSVADVVTSNIDEKIAKAIQKHESQIMKAVSKIVKKQIKPPNVVVSPSAAPAPQINNKIPVPNVIVDMTSVVNAVMEMKRAIEILVETLKPKAFKPRTITLIHDDGTKSTVKEE